MTKVKSREEKLQEAWINYFKNIKKENDFVRLLIEYYKVYTEDKIKDLAESENVYYEPIELSQNIQDIPIDELRNYLHDIEYTSLKELEEEFNSSNEGEFIKATAHFTKHLEAFKSLNSQTKKLIPETKTNRFTSLCLKNFKGFSENNKDEDNTIDIKPITLIYGPNSYGKSSILQSLLLLNQTVKESGDYKVIDLLPNGNMVKLGTFQNFINKNDIRKEFKIELSLPYNRYMYDEMSRYKKINPFLLTKIFFDFHFSFKQEKIVLSEINIYEKAQDYINIQKIISSDKKLICKITLKEKEEQDQNHNIYRIEKYNNGIFSNFFGEEIEKTSFFSLKDDFSIKSSWTNPFDELEEIIKNLVYVSSFRKPASRYYDPENNKRIYVGKNGEYTAEILGYDSKTRKYIDFWLNKIAGYKLSTTKNANSVNLNDKTTEIKNINLIDLGSGIAQVLPIITQAFKSEGEMILIEEPEIHLHPKAQAELGEMFADAIQKKGNTFIIETHSENLMLRLGKLIRTKELSKDDVSIIYVNKDENGSHCIPLVFDDEGDIENIDVLDSMGGFFDEGFEELFL